MRPEQPRTPEDWREYILEIPPEALWEKALTANHGDYIHGLLEDGYSSEEIERVFSLLAARLRALGITPPLDGWYDLAALSKS